MIHCHDSVAARLAGGFGVVQLAMLAMAATSAALLHGIARDNAEAARRRFVALRRKIHEELQMGEGAARIGAELAPAAGAMFDALAASASEVAAKGGTAVARVVQRMQ